MKPNYREKQVQGWSRKKKEALINGDHNLLPALAKNYTQYPRNVVSTSSTTVDVPSSEPVEGNGFDKNKYDNTYE
jgi:putative endonuclease